MKPVSHLRMLELDEVATLLQMEIVRQVFAAHRGEGGNPRVLQELCDFPAITLRGPFGDDAVELRLVALAQFR